MLNRVKDWGAYLSDTTETSVKNEIIRRHTQTGRPLGSDDFVKQLEALTGKRLAPGKPGRKAKKEIGILSPDSPDSRWLFQPC